MNIRSLFSPTQGVFNLLQTSKLPPQSDSHTSATKCLHQDDRPRLLRQLTVRIGRTPEKLIRAVTIPDIRACHPLPDWTVEIVTELF
ncbi:hypothetical protein J6590_011623 [Homalodisca vitripennis]|nr:hypothetical protein J6590_011623 [Homalodisca vitripennis]